MSLTKAKLQSVCTTSLAHVVGSPSTAMNSKIGAQKETNPIATACTTSHFSARFTHLYDYEIVIGATTIAPGSTSTASKTLSSHVATGDSSSSSSTTMVLSKETFTSKQFSPPSAQAKHDYDYGSKVFTAEDGKEE